MKWPPRSVWAWTGTCWAWTGFLIQAAADWWMLSWASCTSPATLPALKLRGKNKNRHRPKANKRVILCNCHHHILIIQAVSSSLYKNITAAYNRPKEAWENWRKIFIWQIIKINSKLKIPQSSSLFTSPWFTCYRPSCLSVYLAVSLFVNIYCPDVRCWWEDIALVG